MKTRVYELVDGAVMAALFSEGAPVRRMCGVPKDHGDLIWEGDMDSHPISGTDDLLTLDGEDDKAEYLVLLRIFDGDDNTCTLLVCQPPYDEGGRS